MCGRDFTTFTEEELRTRFFGARDWPWLIEADMPACPPNYNMCPTHFGLTLSVVQNTLQLRKMRWGLVPPWAKTVKDADTYSMINARSEEVAQKKSYKNAFRSRRCIVPISGFYEWKREGKTKRPYAIELKDKSIMALAGIWEQWLDQDSSKTLLSFSLLTTTANAVMSEVHHRMPVILAPGDERRWLDPELTRVEDIQSLLKPCESDLLQIYEISTLVNSPSNNRPDLLKPV